MQLLSRRMRSQLRALQAKVLELEARRNSVLHVFFASRTVTTPPAQRELWLEFSCVDQDYRIAVSELARLCQVHRQGAGGRVNPASAP